MDQYEFVDKYYKAINKLHNYYQFKAKDEGLAIEATLIAVIKMQKNQEISRDSLSSFLKDADFNQDATEIISRVLADHWSFVLSFANMYENEVLEVLADECLETQTPIAVYQLASELLNIEKNDNILEVFCGYGSFPVCIKKLAFNEYTGIDPEYNSKDTSLLRTALLNGKYNFIVANPIDYNYPEHYDKIISNYPFDLSGLQYNKIREDIQKNFNFETSVVSKCSYDWIRVAEAVYNLKDTGRAIVIINNVSTYNKPDYYMRKYFLENGFIESVINLPASLYKEKNIHATMLVLSHNNTSIRLVNAQNNALKGLNAYKEIIEMLRKPNNNTYDITPKEMYDHDYNLLAAHYLDQPKVENGVPLETVIKSIKRGSQLNVRALVTPDNAVNTYSISLSNISNGLIEFGKDQERITVPDDYLKNHLINKNQMVISKMAAPTFKTAIFNNEEYQPVMASGNLFVIEFDETKVNPYYVQAYFDSEAGETAIQYAAGGSTSKSISMDAIKKVIIPLLPLEAQNTIANEYQEELTKYAFLKNEIKKVINRKRNLL